MSLEETDVKPQSAERGREKYLNLIDTGSHSFIDLDMKKEVKSMIIVCDSCGNHYEDGDGVVCYLGDTDGSEIEQEALSSEWLYLAGKHYCPNCYELDDKDHYHTKDGKVWDADTEKEIES